MTTAADNTSLVEEFGPSIYCADGPDVNFFGVSYPTRMVLISLQDGGVWMWSPIPYSDTLWAEMQERNLNNIQHVVSPNKIHHLFLKEWQEKCPGAKFYSPPGLPKRRVAKGIRFDYALENDKETEFTNEIKHVVFDGSSFMDEVMFYHSKSKTCISCDLIQRFPDEKSKGFKGMLLKLDGLVGEKGSTPREWRLTFLFGKNKVRAAKSTVLNEWKPENLIIAHGHCVDDGTATKVIEQALKWM
jgi:hypothetical protein